MLSSQRRNRICPLSFASLRKEVSVHGQEVKAQDLFRRSDPSSCETRPDEETRPEERTCPAEGESDGHSSHCCRQPADAAATLSPGGPGRSKRNRESHHSSSFLRRYCGAREAREGASRIASRAKNLPHARRIGGGAWRQDGGPRPRREAGARARPHGRASQQGGAHHRAQGKTGRSLEHVSGGCAELPPLERKLSGSAGRDSDAAGA